MMMIQKLYRNYLSVTMCTFGQGQMKTKVTMKARASDVIQTIVVT